MSRPNLLHRMRFGALFLAALILISGGFTALLVPKAAANLSDPNCLAAVGRKCWFGYFDNHLDTGQHPQGGFVLADGVGAMNAADLTSLIGGYLAMDPGNTTCKNYPNNQNATGAAFIVLTMLGAAPGTSKTDACARFNEWQALVNSYDTNGRITWDKSYSYNMDTFYQRNYNDVAATPHTGSDPAITFKNSDGVVLYAIRRACGNPLGKLHALTPISTPATLKTVSTVTASKTSTTSISYINPSQTAYFKHVVDVTNYGGIDHVVKADVYRSRSGGTYTAVRDNGWAGGSFTVTANGSTTIWDGDVPAIAAGTTTPSTQICQKLTITDAGGANLATTDNNAIACVGVRGGKTSAAATVDNPYIEQGETATLLGQISTTSFQGLAAAAYPVTYNYQVTQTAPGTPNPAPTVLKTGSGTQTIDQTGTVTVVSYPYTAPVTAPIGTKVCMTMTVDATSDFGGTTTATTCTMVVAKPYFGVLGGDIIAGANFTSATICSAGSGAAGIKSWNHDTPSFYGAGSQLAALALGDIIHFASATDSTSGNSTAGQSNNSSTNLSFANTSSPIGHLGTLPCMPDYYGQATAQTGVTAVPGPFTFGGMALSKYEQVIMVVNGDVYVTGNVTYPVASSADQIPRFTLIAKGNIYIGSNVTDLHGVYVAQPSSVANSGTIYTCGVWSGPTMIASSDYNTCNQRLTFTGAVAAQRMVLERNSGSLNPLVPNDPAEVFQYSPELWLANATKNTASSRIPYDAITSLPPTL